MRNSGAAIICFLGLAMGAPHGALAAPPSRHDLVPTLLQGGRACGTPAPTLLPAERLFGAPTDCSFTQTSIEAQYEPVNGTIFIPTVVHVIHSTGGTGNLSNEMVQSQIDILNEDFRALSGTPGDAGTDSQIQFVLAGITRTANNSWYAGMENEATEVAAKQALSADWPPRLFLNLYTAALPNYLGWATFPQDPCAFTFSLPPCEAGHPYDGVVILWQSFGRNSPLPPYDQGRTATHEVGHWLGLFHTFQDDGGSGCGSDLAPTCFAERDLICDTPSESGPNFSACPPGAVNSCSPTPDLGNDPIENYMDYSEDACMEKFSGHQNNRMRCSVANYRGALSSLIFADSFGTGNVSRWGGV